MAIAIPRGRGLHHDDVLGTGLTHGCLSGPTPPLNRHSSRVREIEPFKPNRSVNGFATVVAEPGVRVVQLPAADDFLLGVSFGGQWVKGERELKLLPETHDRWETLVCTCTTHANRFLESLGIDAAEADHAITMTQIPHYFGLTPIKTDLKRQPPSS